MLLQIGYYIAFSYSVVCCSRKFKLIAVLLNYVMRSDPIKIMERDIVKEIYLAW